MSGHIALCLDAAMRQNPGLIGLDGETLDSQEWLDVFLNGEEARAGLSANESILEAWVVSSDDVEPINLAATLKADHPELSVRLVSFDGCGSLYSRAHTALIDEVIDGAQFTRYYAQAKHDLSQGRPTETSLAKADVADVKTVKSGKAFLLPIVSGSGGVGKSSVAAVGSLIAQSMGYRTLLLDCDLQFGDVASMVGKPDAPAIDEVASNLEVLERELRADSGLTVVSAPARLETAEEVVQRLPQLIDACSQSFDVIVANTGAMWAEQHAMLLERCSMALFLVGQRASSVRACRHALELCARCGIASGPFRFAVNRCSKNAPLTSIDVSCALQGSPVFELKDGGRDVEDYLGSGSATDLIDVHNEFCSSLAYVMGKLLPGASERVAGLVEPAEGLLGLRKRAGRSGRKRGFGSS